MSSNTQASGRSDLTKEFIQWIGRMVGHRMNAGKWVEIGPFDWKKVPVNWHAYILTFMFHHIGGSKASVLAQMQRRSSESIARCLPASFELQNHPRKPAGFLSGSSVRITPSTSTKRSLSAMSPSMMGFISAGLPYTTGIADEERLITISWTISASTSGLTTPYVVIHAVPVSEKPEQCSGLQPEIRETRPHFL